MLAGCVSYSIVAKKASSHFAKGTVINGVDVSGMDIDSLNERIKEYRIDIREQTKEGKLVTEVLNGTDFSVKVDTDNKQVKKILEDQSVWQYISKAGKEHTVSGWLRYDKKKLLRLINQLQCFDASFCQKPVNAYISEYTWENGYRIVSENNGNTLDKKKARNAIVNAVSAMEKTVNLKKEDCYKEAKVKSDNTKLKKALKKLNRYVSVSIQYRFGDDLVNVDGEQIAKWLTVTEDNAVLFDRSKVAEFVAELRKKYDTIFRSRPFRTSYGENITIPGGDYGWWMNYDQETTELIEQIRKGKSGERKPVYHQEAESYGKKDYGNSYIEVNLTKQHAFLYIDGEMVWESDCVTGNSSRHFDTPVGVYGITYKEKNAVLVGQGYQSKVTYWMPFNGNIGLHDAPWRKGEFGGDIYKTRGSHGCVNLPPKKAKELFSLVKKGMPVICYKSPGKEKNKKKGKTF